MDDESILFFVGASIIWAVILGVALYFRNLGLSSPWNVIANIFVVLGSGATGIFFDSIVGASYRIGDRQIL